MDIQSTVSQTNSVKSSNPGQGAVGHYKPAHNSKITLKDEDQFIPSQDDAKLKGYERPTHGNRMNDEIGKPEDAEDKQVNQFKDQLDEFQAEIRKKLLDAILGTVDPTTKAILQGEFATEHILYEVEDDVEAAEVPEYWNAENTSQRIVDFAMSFAGEDGDPEFLAEVRNAVMEGFAQAKEVLGNIPGESGKLFNDTYESAMSKFDAILEEMNSKKEAQSEISAMTSREVLAQNPYSQTNPTISAPSHQLDLAA